MTTNNGRAAGGTAGTGQGLQGKPDDNATAGRQQPAKWRRVLAALLERGIRGLNRFEAARETRDWCLPTTVSQLEARGIRIDRRDETVPGHFGSVTCCRYWLTSEGCQRARELLGISP